MNPGGFNINTTTTTPTPPQSEVSSSNEGIKKTLNKSLDSVMNDRASDVKPSSQEAQPGRIKSTWSETGKTMFSTRNPVVSTTLCSISAAKNFCKGAWELIKSRNSTEVAPTNKAYYTVESNSISHSEEIKKEESTSSSKGLMSETVYTRRDLSRLETEARNAIFEFNRALENPNASTHEVNKAEKHWHDALAKYNQAFEQVANLPASEESTTSEESWNPEDWIYESENEENMSMTDSSSTVEDSPKSSWETLEESSESTEESSSSASGESLEYAGHFSPILTENTYSVETTQKDLEQAKDTFDANKKIMAEKKTAYKDSEDPELKEELKKEFKAAQEQCNTAYETIRKMNDAQGTPLTFQQSKDYILIGMEKIDK